MSILKVKPIAHIDYAYVNDNDHIFYSCPKCGTIVYDYKGKDVCYTCGTFFDWGDKEPHIETTRKVVWE